MIAPIHHASDEMLAAYAAGSLPHAFSLVVASHISVCDTCRAIYETHLTMGGAVLEDTHEVALSSGLKASVLSQLETAPTAAPEYKGTGIYPSPVMQALNGRTPKWNAGSRSVGQDIIFQEKQASARLIYIPAGQSVPDHSHNGLELTLVLQGSFSDGSGKFKRGDLQIADEDVDHEPVAGPEMPCICLAATDARLSFSTWMPRLIQPLLRI